MKHTIKLLVALIIPFVFLSCASNCYYASSYYEDKTSMPGFVIKHVSFDPVVAEKQFSTYDDVLTPLPEKYQSKIDKKKVKLQEKISECNWNPTFDNRLSINDAYENLIDAYYEAAKSKGLKLENLY